MRTYAQVDTVDYLTVIACYVWYLAPCSFFAAFVSDTTIYSRGMPRAWTCRTHRTYKSLIAITTNIAANAHQCTCARTIGMSDQAIKIVSKHLTGSDTSVPLLTMQIICLVDSYMIWVGAASDSQGEQVEGSAELAPLQGRLARDWACAMPPVYEGSTATASALFRSADSDAAFSMSQRLAKRFKKQIFLSVDIPSEVCSAGQGPAVLLEIEKGVVEELKSV
ncbi:hypothetical protein BJ322DRAFT_117922 [Thelephora terrestris]|uniref:Uncharacterized protein n=1 Tax=Thelephora terrestris TaxID=56493 RepID=A0A9P6LDD5_9AGAM|nr:hypothetical protein BJ322DRAFT_117922 [Thelephora terrestris]